MKYFLLAALLMAGLVDAGQEPPAQIDQIKQRPTYLYAFVKGHQGAIKHYREKQPDRETCNRRKNQILLGNHNRDIFLCAGEIDGYDNTIWTVRIPKKR
jgi:hypothetical protein